MGYGCREWLGVYGVELVYLGILRRGSAWIWDLSLTGNVKVRIYEV